MKGVLQKFNRGEIDTRAMTRDDLDRVTNSCELMQNFMPIRLGPMQYRPGIEYIGDAEDPTTDQNRALIPHIRSVDDSVMYEFSGTTMRPLVDGLPVACSTDTISFTNEEFTTDISGWNTSGTTSPVYSASYSGSVLLRNDAQLYQASGAVTAGVRQTFYITVYSGPAVLKIGDGSSANANDLLDIILYPGEHYVQFIPQTTQFTITLRSSERLFGDGVVRTHVGQCEGISSGDVEFTIDDLDYKVASYDSSADTMFIALGADNHPKMIRRTGSGSANNCGYSWEDYFNINGPYNTINGSNAGLYPVSLTDQTNIVADDDVFTSTDVKRLIKIAHPEVSIEETFTAIGNLSDYIAFRGHGEDREILVTITGGGGSWSVELQRYDWKAGAFTAVRTYTSATTDIVIDKFDGELAKYRFECITYGSAAIKVEMTLVSQGVYGSAKISAFSSTSQVTSDVLQEFMYTNAVIPLTAYWYLGAWYSGAYPQGVSVIEGRIVWASKNRIDMTVTDDYYNFDRDIPGNSAAITRTIGFGPSEDIAWLESSNRLYVGLPSTEVLVRTTGDDEPFTPLNVNLKPGKGLGSAARRPVATDDEIYFVSRDGKRVHALEYDNAQNVQGHSDQMLLHPDICNDGISAMVISKHPEKRLWVLTDTGELRVLLMEPTENVMAWSRITVEGEIEDITVLPATGEDEVWLTIRRGGESRICKMAKFSETKPFDEFVEYTSPGTATLTGLDHLEGETVGVWADGQDRGDETVASGQITVDSAAYTSVIVGLRYTADYKSAKLGEYVTDSVLGEIVTVSNTAVIMEDYAPGALTIGRDFDHLKDLPGSTSGAMVDDYDTIPFGFGGAADTNSRICMRATGPCVVKALVYDVNLKVNKDG